MPPPAKLLVLDQGDVGLDAGRVAIHQEADRAGGGQHRGLGIAEAVAAAARPALRPRALRAASLRYCRAGRRSARPSRQCISITRSIGSRFSSKPSKGPTAAASSAAGAVGRPVQQGRDRAAQPAGRVRIVGQAAGHDQAAQVRVAQPQRPETMAVLGDPLGRIAGVIDQDLLGDEEDAGRPPGTARRRTCRRPGGTSSG